MRSANFSSIHAHCPVGLCRISLTKGSTYSSSHASEQLNFAIVAIRLCRHSLQLTTATSIKCQQKPDIMIQLHNHTSPISSHLSNTFTILYNYYTSPKSPLIPRCQTQLAGITTSRPTGLATRTMPTPGLVSRAPSQSQPNCFRLLGRPSTLSP